MTNQRQLCKATVKSKYIDVIRRVWELIAATVLKKPLSPDIEAVTITVTAHLKPEAGFIHRPLSEGT